MTCANDDSASEFAHSSQVSADLHTSDKHS